MSSKAKKGEILSKEGTVLSETNLELFKAKSEFLVPNCFGSFDPNDPVCQNYCFRAYKNKLDSAYWDVEKRMNETSADYSSFFRRDFKFRRSCEEERKDTETQLEKAKKAIEEEIKNCDYQRSMRDNYHLAKDSRGIGRIPVGEIRRAMDFRDFSKPRILYLETQDTRLFVHPYGPMYDAAVGKVYELHPGGCPPFFDSATDFGFVKSIEPKLPDAYQYRIEVKSQEANGDGDLVLQAKIGYNQQSTKEFPDIHSVNGKEITIVLFGDSAKESVRVDDGGKL